MSTPHIPRHAPRSPLVTAWVNDGVRVLNQDDLQAIVNYMHMAGSAGVEVTIRAGDNAEPGKVEHLRHLAPHELRHVVFTQRTDVLFLVVQILEGGHVSLMYDDNDEPAVKSADLVKAYVTQLDRRPNWERYARWAAPPGLLWLCSVVGLLFASGRIWVIGIAAVASTLAAILVFTRRIPPRSAGAEPYTGNELAQMPTPNRVGRVGLWVGVLGIVLTIILGVLPLFQR